MDALLNIGPLAVVLAGRVHSRWLVSEVESSMTALSGPDLARVRASTD